MKRYRIIFDLCVLILLAFIPLFWIPKGYIVTGHDSGYPINVLASYKNRFYTWNTQDNFGRDNTTSIGTIPLLSIQAAASKIGFDVRSSEMITFIFWFLSMEIAMYAFAVSLYEVFPYPNFPLFASVIYSINYYLLALWRYGAATTFSAFAALPLVILFYLGVLRKKISPLKSGLAIGIVSILFNGGGGLSLPLFGGLLITLIWFSVYFIFTSTHDDRIPMLKSVLKCIISAIISVLGVNAYWFLPFLSYVITHFQQNLADAGGIKAVVSWTDSVSKNTSIINLFRLQGFPDWYNNPYHPYANTVLQKPLFIFLSYLYAPVAYWSLIISETSERKKITVSFVLLSLLGIFFAAGVHEPTGVLFERLMYLIPGFVVFRSAQYKFIPALYFSFAVLIAYVVSYYIEIFLSRIRIAALSQKVLAAVCTVSVIIFILFYHFAYFKQGFFYYTRNLSTLLTVPKHIKVYDAWLAENGDDQNRTLVLPRYNSAWKAGLFDWNYFSLYSPFNLITPKPFVLHSYFLNEAQTAFFHRLADEIIRGGLFEDRLYDLFQINRILWTKDTKNSSDDMPSEDPEIYASALSDAKRYSRVWNMEPWNLYNIQTQSDAHRKIYGLSSVTKYIGQPSDVMANVMLGANNFYLTKILGTKYDNARDVRLPISGVLYASSCDSCLFDTALRDIPLSYTNILPGSLFYSLKRKQEGITMRMGHDVNYNAMVSLNLSLRRIAELGSMIDQNIAESLQAETIRELTSHWKYISDYFETFEKGNHLDMVRTVHEYVASEALVIRKYANSVQSMQIKQQINGLLVMLENIDRNVSETEAYYQEQKAYTVPDGFTKGKLYMDSMSVPRDVNGELIMPDMITIGDRQEKIKPVVDGGKVYLGSFEFSYAKHFLLHFPASPSRLINYEDMQMVTVSGETKQCVGNDIIGFGSLNKYALQINGASVLPPSISFYLVRKNPSYTMDDVYAPVERDAISFDRSSRKTQNIYFSAQDGDYSAKFYICTSSDSDPEKYVSNVRVQQLYAPSIYLAANGDYGTDRIPVTYRRIDQTKYVVTFNEKEIPKILVFHENYDTQWQLYKVNKSMPGILAFTQTWFNRPLPKNTHFSMYGFANAWYLDSASSTDSYIIEYAPQKLFYQGIIIALVSVCVVIFILVQLSRRRK